MRTRLPASSCTLALALIGAWVAAAAARGQEFVAFPENSKTLAILEDGEPYLDIVFMGWGPNWSWLGFDGDVREEAGQSVLLNSAKSQPEGSLLNLEARVAKTGARQLRVDIRLNSTKDTPLTSVVAAVEFGAERFARGKVKAIGADQSSSEIPLPLNRKGIGAKVGQFTVTDVRGQGTRLAMAPPCDVPSDGAARIVLAADSLQAAAPAAVTLTLDLPAEVTYFASSQRIPFEAGFDQWYEFQPDARHDGPSEIGLQNWLEAPAGKHGRVGRSADKLVYNGRPIKLWGLNLCYSACAPDRELAEQRAAFYAKYGINAVRLHKYGDGPGWAGIQSPDSFVDFDPQGLDRMDYLVAQLKQRGIYVKLSAHFGAQKLGPADRQYVPYLEEFGSFAGGQDRVTTPHSAVHYAPELQELQIRQMTNLLSHRNPYTGQTYAEDPAIAFLEIINEQSILFYTSMAPLKASPTLRKKVGQRFGQWLRVRYGTHQRLEQAWGGAAALDCFEQDGFPRAGERLDKDNILPLGNPWYWDPAQLAGSQSSRRQRLLDTLRFLAELQDEFYARYVQAVRTAGYGGEIVASNWQAGRALSHFANLHSDYLVGTIDRHNYFGGGEGNRILNASMLSAPGSGMLSAGLQQVADRPFMLSEWIHVTPNEWGVEGPALVGAYGMGLQGWDVSFMFQNRDRGTFSETIGRERWDVTAPNVLGIFPAVARQVLRGDVAESETLAASYVHVPSLYEGKLGFDDRVQQQSDVKTFGSDRVPDVAVAVARCAAVFSETYQETPPFDVARHLDQGWYVSSTGQLRWRPGTSKLDGCCTIDTPGTNAVVGFADGQVCELSRVSIKPQCRFAAIYVTAQEPDRTLDTANKLLIAAVARARNHGMKVYNDDRLLDRGQRPIVMEPVKAEITLKRAGSATVTLLDHGGRKTDRTLPVRNGVVQIDGSRDRTCYYLVSYAAK